MGLNSKQATASDLDLSDPLPKLSQGRTNSNNQQQERLKCPRCDSTNTKFCYYNNYNRSQPRHLCKACKRHWTQGGTLRNVPVGGARKKKRRKITTTTANPLPTVAPPDHHSPAQFGAEGKTESFSDILHRMLLNSSSADYSFIGSTIPVQSTMFAPNLGSMVPGSAAVNSRMELGATPFVSSYVHGGGQQVEPTLSPATGSAMTGWAGESSGIGDCWSSWDVNDDICPPGP